MQYFKKFTTYTPQDKPFGENVAYLQAEDGQDWYSVQRLFKTDTVKVMFDEQGAIVAVSKDVSTLYPLNCGVLELPDEDMTMQGLYVNDGKLIRTPRPSDYHEWNGKEWVISSEKQAAYLAQGKETLLTTLANRADQLKTGLLVGYPQTEIESFYRQEKEALAWQADNSTVTPMLTQIAKLRGMPFEILVQKVIEKSNQFAVAIGIIIGQRQKFEDRLLAATDIKQLDELEQEINAWQFQAS